VTVTTRLKKWHFIAPSVLASVIAVAYFTAGPRVPMDNDQTSQLAIAEQENEKAGEQSAQFDKDIVVGDVTVNLSEPKSIKITDPSIDATGKSPNLIVATIKNNGKSVFQAYSFSLGTPIIENNTDAYCEQLFPMQDGIPAQPDNLDIEAGGSRTFYWVYMCEAKQGDPVSLNVTVTDKSLLTFVSKIK
jgi:hypothetical protein